mgnify:CR=1 FL=1
MKNFTDQQIAQRYDDLPEDLKDAIFSVDTTSLVNMVGKKHGLAIDKIGDLANETGMVMLGVTHPNEFIANLADRLEVDKEKARIIAQEINEQIFKPVRDSLRKIHNIREGGEEDKEEQTIKTIPTVSKTEKIERSDILKEIEKDHSKENDVPEIMRGNANPFEEKMKEGVLLAPVEERHYIEEKTNTTNLPEPARPAGGPEKPKGKYQGFDPYKEPIE